jgi:hypothetical protein
MRRAILFGYHAQPSMCRNHITLLRRLNPGVAIYGMYGGQREHAPILPFDHNYTLPFPEPRYKSTHTDLCARQWFIDCGYRFRFDMLHMVQWDLIFTKPISMIFSGVNDGIGATHIENIAAKRASRWPWITSEIGHRQLQELRSFVRKKYGIDFTDEMQLVCDFPGTCLSRAFMERYAKDDVPALLLDEVRVPMYAQIYGFPIHDTHLRSTFAYWNCSKFYIPVQRVYGARHKQHAFHPVKGRLNISWLLS